MSHRLGYRLGELVSLIYGIGNHNPHEALYLDP